MSRLAFRGAHVLTMDPDVGDIPAGTVVVDGRRIAAVGPDGAVPVPDGARVVDARGMALLPGLVNCHTHAAMTLLRGYGADLPLQRWLEERIWPAEDRLQAEDVYWGALLSCAEMLRGGTTTFADMYFFMDETARAVDESGLRAVLGRGLVGLDGAERGEARLREGVAFCRRWQGAAGGRIGAWLAPHAEYTCPPELLRETVAAARDLGTGIHVHLSETAAEVEACRSRHGMSPVAWLRDLGLFSRPALAAHCVHVDADDVAILASCRVGVSHNPVSNCKLASGVSPVVELQAAGVPVGLGTDGAASTDSLSLWEEMRLAAWLQKVVRRDAAALPARTVLEMATRTGAEILGLGAVCGRVAPGLAADLCLVDLGGPHLVPHPDPAAALVYGARDEDVRWVLVDGRVCVEDGRVVAVDLERARAEVKARSVRLTGVAEGEDGVGPGPGETKSGPG